MAPAQPPLPSCRYWAFQAGAAGSQRANLISESRLGRMTPRTSQWAGTAPDPLLAHPERRAAVRRLPGHARRCGDERVWQLQVHQVLAPLLRIRSVAAAQDRRRYDPRNSCQHVISSADLRVGSTSVTRARASSATVISRILNF